MKLSNIIATLFTLLALWAIVSTIEINCKNLESNPQYSPANLWILALDATEVIVND